MLRRRRSFTGCCCDAPTFVVMRPLATPPLRSHEVPKAALDGGFPLRRIWREGCPAHRLFPRPDASKRRSRDRQRMLPRIGRAHGSGEAARVSAIFGVIGLDATAVGGGRAASMDAAMAHRGRIGWLEVARNAALGARGPRDGSLATLTLPSADRPRRIVVVADARLDDREALAREIGAAPSRELSDADLILRAYLHWGDGTAARLTGDFAFVVHDERTGRVLLGRDRMGVKPLYLYRGGGTLAFATEIRGLLALPFVPRQTDPEQIGLQLAWGEPDREGTVYRAIRRLPAAHCLTLSPGAMDRPPTRYWSLDAVAEVRRSDAREYAAGLAEVLRMAVRDRMRGEERVASTLSGGLDSSTIACIARQEAEREGSGEVHAISLVFDGFSADDTRLLDEREYMRAVIDGGGLIWHPIAGDGITPLGDVDEMLAAIGQPFAAPNAHLHWQMYREAASAGAEVFLDGVDGDTAVSHGFGRLNGQLARRDWDGFAREVNAFGERDGRGSARVLQHYGLPYLEDLAEAGRWREWMAAAGALSTRFSLSRRQLLWRRGIVPGLSGMRPGTAATQPIGEDLLDPRIVERLADRMPSLSQPRATLEREGHRAGVMQPAYQGTLELADACAAHWGLTPRYPFFDRRVIEYCLSLPDEEKLSDGWSRLVLRRAMEGILPPEVQWRVGKSNLSPAFAAALRGVDREEVAKADLAPLAPYARLDVVERARGRLMAGELTGWGDPDGYLVYRAVVAARWLRSLDGPGQSEPGQGRVRPIGRRERDFRRRAPAA